MQSIEIPSGAEVKRAALMDHLHSGALHRQQDAVLIVLAMAGESLTRHEIAERGGMALSAACGRVSTLKDADLIEVDKPKKAEGARSPRSTLRLTEKGRAEAERILAELSE